MGFINRGDIMTKFRITSLVSLFSFILLSSCASDGDCPNVKDSPEPASNLMSCKQVKALAIGSSCRTSIAAIDAETDVGLTVKQNEEYKVEVTDCNQVWKDCTRRSFPLCGEAGSFWMDLVAFKKKQPDALWFSVIAEIRPVNNKNPISYDLCGKITDRDTARTAIFEVVNDGGELFMYPNDAEDHYDNNRGKIWLDIQRVK